MLRLACALAQRAKRGEERQSTASGPFSADQVVATEANRCDTSSHLAGALRPMSVQATSGPGTGAGTQGRRLESWKEIASCRGRDVTTVRRWEKREGLPVHRLHHSKLGSLYAFTAELDAWRDKRAPAGTADAPLIPGLPEVILPNAPMRRMAARAALALMLVLTLAAGLTWFMRARTDRKPASANGDLRSLAVLPLENLTGDPSQEYFADGMTDALITALAQVRGLKVMSRTSV